MENLDSLAKVMTYLGCVAIVSFVGWTIGNIFNMKTSFSKQISDFREEVAKTYIKSDNIDDLKKEVRLLSNIVHEIAGKLGVSTRNEK